MNIRAFSQALKQHKSRGLCDTCHFSHDVNELKEETMTHRSTAKQHTLFLN